MHVYWQCELMRKSRPFIFHYMVLSFIILPITILPYLIYSRQMDRYSYALAGFWGVSIQIAGIASMEARFLRLRLFSYQKTTLTSKDRHIPFGTKVGTVLNIIMLCICACVLCYGIYYAIWYENTAWILR